ncbi:MAG: cyclic nucleotide-binding domain-containing protein [Deltaproteobacteria bacterium]|nr:cyclic nucleotide-binding domain-containing protein [Deltaproteobacteria bacterium]
MGDVQVQLYTRFGKKIPAGTVLFQEGDKGEEMFILQSGKVKISKRIRGVEKTLATLEKGEFFGEMAILNDKPRSATAETIEECEMLVIDRKTFDTLLRGNVEIAIRFIKRLADRLREANDQMEALMIKDNTSRLVSILAKQVKERKKSGDFFVTIDDLAGLAGIETSQVKMILEKLASVRIVELSNEKVHITSQDQADRLLRYLEMREIFGEMG